MPRLNHNQMKSNTKPQCLVCSKEIDTKESKWKVRCLECHKKETKKWIKKECIKCKSTFNIGTSDWDESMTKCKRCFYYDM